MKNKYQYKNHMIVAYPWGDKILWRVETLSGYIRANTFHGVSSARVWIDEYTKRH